VLAELTDPYQKHPRYYGAIILRALGAGALSFQRHALGFRRLSFIALA